MRSDTEKIVMDEMKRKRLENAGFRFGDAYAFLDSTEEEIRKAESPSKGDACCLAKIPVKGMENGSETVDEVVREIRKPSHDMY